LNVNQFLAVSGTISLSAGLVLMISVPVYTTGHLM